MPRETVKPGGGRSQVVCCGCYWEADVGTRGSAMVAYWAATRSVPASQQELVP